MSQIYTSGVAFGDCPAVVSITAMPIEVVGTQGVTAVGPVGGLDFNYKNQINGINTAGTPVVGTANTGNMFGELQDFISKWVKSDQTTPRGISPQTDAAGNTITGGNPYGNTGPREVIFRIKMLCEAMLSQSNG